MFRGTVIIFYPYLTSDPGREPHRGENLAWSYFLLPFSFLATSFTLRGLLLLGAWVIGIPGENCINNVRKLDSAEKQSK